METNKGIKGNDKECDFFYHKKSENHFVYIMKKIIVHNYTSYISR